VSADNIPGPRNGAGVRHGQFQDPSLDATAKHWDLSAWKGEYVKLKWTPAAATPDAEVLFAFYPDIATAVAATLDATTASADTASTTADQGADWLDKYHPVEHMRVPRDAPVLKVISSVANGGRFAVRHAEAGADETGELV
jgi:hypothetical protein